MYEWMKDNGREKFAGATVTTWPLHKAESAEDAKKRRRRRKRTTTRTIMNWEILKISENTSKRVELFFYKVVFGLVGVNIDDFFEFNHAANTRGHAYKLFKSRSVDNIRQNFFAERIVNVWNGLPPSVSFASLSTFRRTIQKVDFSQCMKCTWLFNFTIFF